MQLHTHTAGQDSRVQVYDLRKKAKIQTLDKHVNAVSSLAFSPCGNYVRSPSSLRHLRFLLHIPSILLAWDRIDRVSPGVAWESGDDYVFRFISDSLSQGSMNDANSSPVLSLPFHCFHTQLFLVHAVHPLFCSLSSPSMSMLSLLACFVVAEERVVVFLALPHHRCPRFGRRGRSTRAPGRHSGRDGALSPQYSVS